MEGINKICKHDAACNSIDRDGMQPLWLDLIILLVIACSARKYYQT